MRETISVQHLLVLRLLVSSSATFNSNTAFAFQPVGCRRHLHHRHLPARWPATAQPYPLLLFSQQQPSSSSSGIPSPGGTAATTTRAAIRINTNNEAGSNIDESAESKKVRADDDDEDEGDDIFYENDYDGEECAVDNDDFSRLIQSEIDLAREQTRMESFEEYVLISVLTASASFGVLTSSNSGSEQHMSTLAILSAGMSALCGLHATVVFSLSALYGKSCIGRNQDEHYQYLLDTLIEQRKRAFLSFSLSLLLFSMEIGLLLYEAVPPSFQPLTLITAGGMLYMIVADWAFIVDKAKVIYTSEVPTTTTEEGQQ